MIEVKLKKNNNNQARSERAEAAMIKASGRTGPAEAGVHGGMREPLFMASGCYLLTRRRDECVASIWPPHM